MPLPNDQNLLDYLVLIEGNRKPEGGGGSSGGCMKFIIYFVIFAVIVALLNSC